MTSVTLPLSSPPRSPPPSSTPLALTYRTLRPEDLAEVKDLHEELFPVRYSDAFYDCAVRGYLVGTCQPLFTLAAVEVLPEEGEERRERQGGRKMLQSIEEERNGVIQGDAGKRLLLRSRGLAPPPSFPSCFNSTGPSPPLSPPPSSSREGRLLGIILAQLLPFSECAPDDADLLLPAPRLAHSLLPPLPTCPLPSPSTHALYILTLGTRPDARRQGLARSLLLRTLSQASLPPSPPPSPPSTPPSLPAPHLGLVYLHVLPRNQSAIAFYVQQGFQCRGRLPRYYVINGKEEDAYLYVRYAGQGGGEGGRKTGAMGWEEVGGSGGGWGERRWLGWVRSWEGWGERVWSWASLLVGWVKGGGKGGREGAREETEGPRGPCMLEEGREGGREGGEEGRTSGGVSSENGACRVSTKCVGCTWEVAGDRPPRLGSRDVNIEGHGTSLGQVVSLRTRDPHGPVYVRPPLATLHAGPARPARHAFLSLLSGVVASFSPPPSVLPSLPPSPSPTARPPPPPILALLAGHRPRTCPLSSGTTTPLPGSRPPSFFLGSKPPSPRLPLRMLRVGPEGRISGL
ncbi:GNAT domain protein [Nannochloropsis gaditana]|uniref:N-alpha-acetyltransferase 60 n=1 Tax=Nannochloropsis gaditana TaxID=72520 RepID=W7TKK1_9STRA|nr:GNAT domain protein [Nannochloropsis gaditana]